MFEQPDGALAVIGVAIVIAVDEVRPDFSQVACSNWLSAHQTKGLRTGRPAIHQDESHVAPPNVKQNTVSVGWGPRLAGGEDAGTSPLGWSRLCSVSVAGMVCILSPAIGSSD